MSAKCGKCGLSVNNADPEFEKAFIKEHEKEAHPAPKKSTAKAGDKK